MNGASPAGVTGGPGRHLHRVARGVRRVVSPATLFVDPHRDTDRAVLLVGSARSGTTKLAETLASARTTRIIFEPMHPRRSSLLPGRIIAGTYRAPDASGSGDDEVELLDAWSRALDGRFRSRRTDEHNRARFASRRVVKCIVATNLVAWLRSRYPEVPIVYVHRHPLAVASSVEVLARHEAGWHLTDPAMVAAGFPFSGMLDGPLADRADDIRSLGARTESRVVAKVARWCHDNWLPLREPPATGFLSVRHEDFVDDPAAVIRRMEELTGFDLSRGLGRAEVRSGSDWSARYRDPSHRGGRRDGWRETTAPEIRDAATEVLEVFGLREIVGD